MERLLSIYRRCSSSEDKVDPWILWILRSKEKKMERGKDEEPPTKESGRITGPGIRERILK